MARARNIKPAFFVERVLVAPPIDRLLFIGLWCLADREGRVEDRPRRIKMELFPCDTYDVEAGLESLRSENFITRYGAGGVKVISICNFLKHQTPHGTEKDSELPDESGCMTICERDARGYVLGTKRQNNVKTAEFNEGITVNSPLEKVNPPLDNALNPDSLNPDSLNPEQKTKAGKKPPAFDPKKYLIENGVDDETADDWLLLRRQKKAAASKTAISGIQREAKKAGITLQTALELCCQRGWVGFKAEWAERNNGINGIIKPFQSQADLNRAAIGNSLFGNQQREEKIIEGECHAAKLVG